MGMGELFSRAAPVGQFRVIGVDTFDGTDWHEKDFFTLLAAQEYIAAKTRGKETLKYHVYDDKGGHVAHAVTF